MAGRPWPPLEVRFWRNVDKHSNRNGCWEWTAHTASGYGRIFGHGRTHAAHRLSYEWLVGPIPDELVIDHLCRNRRCVNPEHLEAVTFLENTRRGTFFDQAQRNYEAKRRKTHCKRGHPLSGENLYLQGNMRSCRTCRREATRRSDQRRKGRK